MFGYFAFAGLAILTVLLYGSTLLKYLAERREQRKFSEFDDVISGKIDDPEKAEKFFSGEISLRQRVQVLFPIAFPEDQRMEVFDQPVSLEMNQSGFGELVRGFTMDDSSGLDVELYDFVQGVDTLRQILIRLQAPHGTLIEYSQGDLPIYDD